MASSLLASLPIVDLEKAKDPTQRLAVAKQLVHALESVGFLFVDNVDGYDMKELLSNARWFFDLGEQEKHSVARKIWNPQSPNHYRGYFPLQAGEVSYKEGFEVGEEKPPRPTNKDHPADAIHPFFAESNLWPSKETEGAERFKDFMARYYRSMLDCGAEILRLVSLGCGLQEDWFQSLFFPGSLSTLRLLHYPPRPVALDEARDGDTALSCSEHSDSGFVTLLSTFHYNGLQIQQDDGGDWMSVPSRPNSLVMNIGDMLSSMSSGRFKATQHRVVETGLDRYSVPFFFEPRYSADVCQVMPNTLHDADKSTVAAPKSSKGESSSLATAESGMGREVTGATPEPASKLYGPWLIEKMRSFAEYREILDSLPPVAARA